MKRKDDGRVEWGKQLRASIKEAGVSQGELSRRLGKSKQYISQICGGHGCFPTEELARKILEAGVEPPPLPESKRRPKLGRPKRSTRSGGGLAALITSQEIVRLRARLGLGMEEFANLVGVSLVAERAWERGTSMPSMMILMSILEKTGVNLVEVVHRELFVDR